MLMSMHVRFQPSVCLLGASGRPTLIIGNLFPLVDCTEESFPSHSNLRVAQSWLVNFPLHYRSSNRLISLGRVAAIIVFYLSFRRQFTCASSPSVKETEEGKMKMLPLFTSTHHPFMTWHTECKSNMNLVPHSAAFCFEAYDTLCGTELRIWWEMMV